MQQAVAGRLAGQPDFPLLLSALAAAYNGNAAALVTSAPPTIDAFWGFPLICNDYRECSNSPVRPGCKYANDSKAITDKSFEGYRKVIDDGVKVRAVSV